MKKHAAFSLTELSLVVLVIGILIAAITQGRSIVMGAKLNAAQTQTAQSPVPEIDNLIAWWETTLDRSFDSTSRYDGTTLGVWYDINPKGLSALATWQNTGSNQPTYKINSDNGLPMLRFDSDGSDYLWFPDGTVPDGDRNYTIFVVGKFSACSSDSNCSIFSSGTTGGTKTLNALQYNSTYVKSNWQGSSLIATTTVVDSSHIISSTYSNASGRKIFVDGTQITSDSASVRASTRVWNIIGSDTASGSLIGYLGEFIIYDRNLKGEERKSVEKYLSRKWGIAVN